MEPADKPLVAGSKAIPCGPWDDTAFDPFEECEDRAPGCATAQIESWDDSDEFDMLIDPHAPPSPIVPWGRPDAIWEDDLFAESPAASAAAWMGFVGIWRTGPPRSALGQLTPPQLLPPGSLLLPLPRCHPH